MFFASAGAEIRLCLLVAALMGIAPLARAEPAAGEMQTQPAEASAEGHANPVGVRALGSRRLLHPWDRYVRGFRREHNMALSLGITSGRWQINKLGSMEGRSSSEQGVYTRCEYSFHLPLVAGFGYMLGSPFGYHYVNQREAHWRSVSAVMFPGMLAGLVANFNPVLRLGIMASAWLERHEGIEERDVSPPATNIFVTLESYDLSAFVDVFVRLGWALRIEAHDRQLIYARPHDAENYEVNAKIEKRDRWYGVGTVLHLL